MGLGKTLSMISLVVQKKDEGVREWMAKPPSKEGETINSTDSYVPFMCN